MLLKVSWTSLISKVEIMSTELTIIKKMKLKSINWNLIFSSRKNFPIKTSLSTSSFPYPLVKMSIILQKMAKWGPLIKLSNLFKVFVFISSVWTCLLSVCFFETAVEILADLFDVDDAAGVTVLSIRFCPPTAGDYLQTIWFGEVCLLDDVAENNKLG